MSKYILSPVLVLLSAAMLFNTGCEKKYIIDVTKKCDSCAEVKILNGYPNADSSFQFYINGVKITGNALEYADLFPATVEYAAVSAGNDEVTIKLAVNDSTFTTVASGSLNLMSHKRYGLIWNNDSKKEPIILIPNRDEPTDSGFIMANFVNLIKPEQSVDIISQTSGEAVFSAVPYEGVKDYVKIPKNDKYTIRETGTNIVLATDQSVGSSDTRNYTWYARGAKYDTIKGSPTQIVLDYYTNGYPEVK